MAAEPVPQVSFLLLASQSLPVARFVYGPVYQVLFVYPATLAKTLFDAENLFGNELAKLEQALFFPSRIERVSGLFKFLFVFIYTLPEASHRINLLTKWPNVDSPESH